jgi:hypothetical protein
MRQRHGKDWWVFNKRKRPTGENMPLCGWMTYWIWLIDAHYGKAKDNYVNKNAHRPIPSYTFYYLFFSNSKEPQLYLYWL